MYSSLANRGETLLTLCRRHTRSCGQKDRYYRRRKCPVWVEGATDAGEHIRHSLRLTFWERGEDKKRETRSRARGGRAIPRSSSRHRSRILRDKECEARGEEYLFAWANVLVAEIPAIGHATSVFARRRLAR